MDASVHRPIIATRLSSCQRCGVLVKSNSWDFREFIRPGSGLVAVGDFISIFESRTAYYIVGPLGAYENIAGRVVGIDSSSRSHILFSIQYSAQHIVTLRVPFHLSHVGRLRHIQHTIYQWLDFGQHRVVAPIDDSLAPVSEPASILPVLDVQGQGTGEFNASQESMEAPSSPYSYVSALPPYYSSSLLLSSSSLPSYSTGNAGIGHSRPGQLECWRRSNLPGADDRDHRLFSSRFVHRITSPEACAPILPGLHGELIKTEEDVPSAKMAMTALGTLTEASLVNSLWEY